ncbi:MAG: hypothetical protein HDR85_08240 [Bacteroides sp.]|nr:hypothetical protein [Bacteroides sp.]
MTFRDPESIVMLSGSQTFDLIGTRSIIVQLVGTRDIIVQLVGTRGRAYAG